MKELLRFLTCAAIILFSACDPYRENWERWINCSLEHDGLVDSVHLGRISLDRIQSTSQELSHFAGISFDQARRVYACKALWFNALNECVSVVGKRRTKVLHVTLHPGLHVELQATLRFFPCMEVETFAFNDGENTEGEEAGLNYNVHAVRADMAWRAHSAYFETFDIVVCVPFLFEWIFPLGCIQTHFRLPVPDRFGHSAHGTCIPAAPSMAPSAGALGCKSIRLFQPGASC
jgi:hypothetical protein